MMVTEQPEFWNQFKEEMKAKKAAESQGGRKYLEQVHREYLLAVNEMYLGL
jgi:hypothetical protein